MRGDFLKFRITSFHLIVAIIIQIIVIDILIAALLFGKLTPVKAEMAGIRSTPPNTKTASRLNSAEKKEALIELIEKTWRLGKAFEINDGTGYKKEFTATAYDLSFECCGKYPSHPEYGITFSGRKAVRGRTIAVDPVVIPLGSKVHIEFPFDYSYLNGVYIAEDIGSKVKGNIIDIFLGESAYKEMEKFGSMKVYVTVIESAGNNR